jgi:hypothetical protein
MKQLKEYQAQSNKINITDLINVVAGVTLLVSLVLIFQHPTNRYAILAACLSGGLMNILTGVKQMKDPKRKTMGMSFLMMGAIVILLGFIIMNML